MINIKRIKWKYSNSAARFKMVMRAAKSPCFDGFRHMIRWDEVNSVIHKFGYMKAPGLQFDDVLFRYEYLFVGNRMYNDLIVCFRADFSFTQLFYLEEHVEKIESSYPQLRYVLVLGNKKALSKSYDKMGLICLDDYTSPESVVKDLEKFTVDPKKCVMPIFKDNI